MDPRSPDEVETLLIETVRKCVAGLDDRAPNREWTRALKEAVGALGEKRGWHAWYSGHPTEWLYDLCWVDLVDGDWRRIRRLALACEVEWNPSIEWLLEDFLKLTVCDSAHRLFVFDAGSADPASVIGELKAVCPQGSGKRYLAVALRGKQAVCEAWVA